MEKKTALINTEDGQTATLPKEVREHETTKTSVYRQGELIYDGATGKGVGGPPGSDGPGQSLNELLKWSIQNSDPAELARRADRGVAPPSQIDREILDMMLGQPTVAKMRECLGKLDSASLCALGGLDAGLGALEELEFHAEDLDNAVDLAKIGGLRVLKRVCVFGLGMLDGGSGADASAETSAAEVAAAEAAAAKASPEECAELREAACGVLAAMVQNNPKAANASRACGAHGLLLALLGNGGEGAHAAKVGGLPVIRKALLALSALLRTHTAKSEAGGKERTLAAAAAEAEGAAAAAGEGESDGGVAEADAALALALPTLCRLASHPDGKVRRRTYFLLASLAADGQTAAAAGLVAHAVGAAGEAMAPGLLRSLGDEEDEDCCTQSARLILALSSTGSGGEGGEGGEGSEGGEGGKALKAFLLAAGGVDAVTAALQRAIERSKGGEGDPEAPTRLRKVLAWLSAPADGTPEVS